MKRSEPRAEKSFGPNRWINPNWHKIIIGPQILPLRCLQSAPIEHWELCEPIEGIVLESLPIHFPADRSVLRSKVEHGRAGAGLRMVPKLSGETCVNIVPRYFQAILDLS